MAYFYLPTNLQLIHYISAIIIFTLLVPGLLLSIEPAQDDAERKFYEVWKFARVEFLPKQTSIWVTLIHTLVFAMIYGLVYFISMFVIGKLWLS